MERLPERCRLIFQLRRVEGMSQRQIAQVCGVTENVVENEAAQGLRVIVAALRERGSDLAARYDRRMGKRAARA